MELPFLLMSRVQAAQVRNETAGDQNRLEPREVTVGNHKGQFAVNVNVLTDPAYEDRRDMLLMLGNPVVLETTTAFFTEETEEVQRARWDSEAV